MITWDSLGDFPESSDSFEGMSLCYLSRVRLKTLLGLIIGNFIWSLHPAMGKLVLADFTPAEGAWLRYSSALVAFILCIAFIPKLRQKTYSFGNRRGDWVTVVLVGLLGFCFSPLLQLTGLNMSRATDNALIIAMEPMITILLAWILLREKVTFSYVLMLLTALVGVALLSGLPLSGSSSSAFFWGDVIMLLSLFGEGFYSVGGRKLVHRNSPVVIYGWAILFGVVFLTVAVAIFWGQGPIDILRAASHQLTWKSALALAWLGPMGTTASYLYWMYALREAPVASVALTLFIQPVFGSLWGYLFLSERLGLSQTLGGVLIIAAVFAQTLSSIRRARLGRRAAVA